jgi:hypothetical protein
MVKPDSRYASEVQMGAQELLRQLLMASSSLLGFLLPQDAALRELRAHNQNARREPIDGVT